MGKKKKRKKGYEQCAKRSRYEVKQKRYKSANAARNTKGSENQSSIPVA